MAGATAFSSGCLSLAALLSRVNCFAMDTGNGTVVPDGWRNAATYSRGRGRGRGRIFSLRDLSASRQSDESAASSTRRPTDRRAGTAQVPTVPYAIAVITCRRPIIADEIGTAPPGMPVERRDIAIFSCVIPIYRDMLVRLSDIISAELASRLILYNCTIHPLPKTYADSQVFSAAGKLNGVPSWA